MTRRRVAAQNVPLRQSYARVGRLALMKPRPLCPCQVANLARRELKRLKTLLGRVVRDIRRKIDGAPALVDSFRRPLWLAECVAMQKRRDPQPKVYSLHAPEVECISKEKVAKSYEFGGKVTVESAEAWTCVTAKRIYVDKGYRDHGPNRFTVWRSGSKTPTSAICRELRRRNAIEPIIGHMKNDGRLGRNFLAGKEGDRIDAILSGAGYNFRLLLRWLRFFAPHSWDTFYR